MQNVARDILIIINAAYKWGNAIMSTSSSLYIRLGTLKFYEAQRAKNIKIFSKKGMFFVHKNGKESS
jgi:hypothetical protein